MVLSHIFFEYFFIRISKAGISNLFSLKFKKMTVDIFFD